MANLTDTTIFRSLNSETPMYNADNVDTLINGLSTTYAKKADVYTKTEVDDAITEASSKVYRFKGTVATYADLPKTGLTIGDVYNVEDGGKNYAWTGDGAGKVGDGWDDIGGVVDLSNYYTSDVIDSMFDEKVDKEVGKGLSTNDYTTADKTKLGNIAEGAQVNVIETVKVNGTPLTVTGKAVNIDLSGKADKVANATSGNLAGRDANGNLTDSGSKASDFATATALSSHTGNTTVHITSAERTKWNNKQDAISDLETIRSGAAAGATAYQKPATGIPYADLSSGVKGSLDKADTALQAADLADYAKKTEMSVVPGTGDDADKTTITLKTGTSATVLTAHQDISGKADKTTFASLKNLETVTENNFDLTELVRKYNALVNTLKSIESALNPSA